MANYTKTNPVGLDLVVDKVQKNCMINWLLYGM